MRLWIGMAIGLALSGCAPIVVGNSRIRDDAIVSRIAPGASSKADVESILGKPLVIDFTDAGYEKWVYTHIHADNVFAASKAKTHTLTVQFTKEGIVQNLGRGEQ